MKNEWMNNEKQNKTNTNKHPHIIYVLTKTINPTKLRPSP